MHESVEGAADLPRVAFDVGVEESLADDGQRESHHLLMNVDHFPICPALLMALCQFHHGTAIADDSLTMERWLKEPALPQMKTVFAGQHSVTQYRASAL